ncbi:NAD(P)/FAD-dependent oxidoreductase [Halorarius litoreus]|uniref:NAD(P)/FAD-dependent oxidoreductase n=1 Tax=Halorarius litoreus TaxID=2962676 RepID=UPI0033140B7D
MRVAVLGAGYAGLTVARRLERRLSDDVDLVVVDASPDHLVLHELHRVVRHPDLAEVITVPLEDLFDRATVRQARVTDVDTDAGVATLDTDTGTEELDYDAAAVCLGSETAFYGLPGVEAHATPLKSLDDAFAIRQGVLAADDGGRVVVGGAGLSGVQLAGELAALGDEEDIALDVTLLEQADRVAPGFDTAFAAALDRELTDRGVTVETGTTVESATEDEIALADDRTLPYDVFVWTGGIGGPAALGGTRPSVGADLRVGESTFVVGDAARVTDAAAKQVPATAQAAVREARVAARNAERLVTEGPTDAAGDNPFDAFTFDSVGWVASVGDGAVAQVGPVVLSGDPARAAKAVIGAGHLGSVGEIEAASTLVNHELGWPTGSDAVARLVTALQTDHLTQGTDPASPSELEVPLAVPALGLLEAVAPAQGVDLTALTRLADRTAPGSPANAMGRALADSVGLFGAVFGRPSDDDAE